MPLSTDSGERFGFANAETATLSSYLGTEAHLDEWSGMTGIGLAGVSVFSPWSVINYLEAGCGPGTYWVSTALNGVVGDAVRVADEDAFEWFYALFEPGGYIVSALDLGVVFPVVGGQVGCVLEHAVSCRLPDDRPHRGLR